VDGELEQLNLKLQKKYERIRRKEVRFEERFARDCEVLVVAYGTSARLAKGAMNAARAKGIRVGLLRPITLWPFPYSRIAELAAKAKGILVIEMSAGQMIEDVRLAVGKKPPVSFVGRTGGGVPSEKDILRAIKTIVR